MERTGHRTHIDGSTVVLYSIFSLLLRLPPDAKPVAKKCIRVDRTSQKSSDVMTALLLSLYGKPLPHLTRSRIGHHNENDVLKLLSANMPTFNDEVNLKKIQNRFHTR